MNVAIDANFVSLYIAALTVIMPHWGTCTVRHCCLSGVYLSYPEVLIIFNLTARYTFWLLINYGKLGIETLLIEISKDEAYQESNINKTKEG